MEYIIVEGGKIVDHCCGDVLPEGAIMVPDDFGGYVGMDFELLKDDLSGPIPVSEQVARGFMQVPDGYKVNDTDDGFIPMDTAELAAKYPAKVFAVEGTFEEIVVDKTFDPYGNFDYYPPMDAVEMPGRRPTLAHKAVGGEWVLDLDAAKENKRAAVVLAYEEAMASAKCASTFGFEVNANEAAERSVRSLIDTKADGEEIQFRAYDNKFYPLTKKQLPVILAEIVDYENNMKQKLWAAKDAIAAATTGEELDAIDISF